jgi:XXXCH domain-containing protein
MKTLKKDLEVIFDSILEKSKTGEVPSESEVAQFERLSRRFLSMANDAWLEECEDFVHLANQLLKAVKKGQAHDAIQLVESLNDARTFCHRTYKD